MKVLYDFQKVFVAIAVIVFVGISYRVASLQSIVNSVYAPEIIALIISVLTYAISKRLADWLANQQGFRRRLLRDRYVEGHWFLLTRPVKEDDDSPILLPGVLHLSFDLSSGEFSARTTRVRPDGNDFITASEVANARVGSGATRYLNFFVTSGPKEGRINGFSNGQFLKAHEYSKYRTKLQADISLQNENFTREQNGKKIPTAVARTFFKKFGDNWVKEFLARCRSFEDLERIENSRTSLRRMLETSE